MSERPSTTSQQKYREALKLKREILANKRSKAAPPVATPLATQAPGAVAVAVHYDETTSTLTVSKTFMDQMDLHSDMTTDQLLSAVRDIMVQREEDSLHL
jgi:hypothetical protein